MIMKRPIWLDYATYYPDEDDPEFDGEHYGGLKGLREDTPNDIRAAYDRDMKSFHETETAGIDI